MAPAGEMARPPHACKKFTIMSMRQSSALGSRRKVRSDAKLERLSAEQRERVSCWLQEEGGTYLRVAERIRANFGVSVSKSAVGVFWQRHVRPPQEEDEVRVALALAASLSTAGSPATLRRAKYLAWSLLARSAPEIHAATRLLGALRRFERRALACRRRVLAERRAAFFRRTVAPVAAHSAPSKSPPRSPLFPAYPALPSPPPPAFRAVLPGSARDTAPVLSPRCRSPLGPLPPPLQNRRSALVYFQRSSPYPGARYPSPGIGPSACVHVTGGSATSCSTAPFRSRIRNRNSRPSARPSIHAARSGCGPPPTSCPYGKSVVGGSHA